MLENDDYFREQNIIQIYTSQNLNNEAKKYFCSKYNLCEYKSKNIPLLYVGSLEKKDKDIILSHKNKIHLFLYDSNINEINDFILNCVNIEKVYILQLDITNNKQINDKIVYLDEINIINKIFPDNKIINGHKIIPGDKIDKKYKITLVTIKTFQFISYIIRDILIDLGWEVDIISNENIMDYKEHINNCNHYFIFFYIIKYLDIDFFNINKNNYIIYQFEQHNGTKINIYYYDLMKNGKLKNIYENSKFVLDYTKHNINVTKNILNYEPIYLPTPIKRDMFDGLIDKNSDNEICNDVIFVGNLNQRRKNIFRLLGPYYDVNVPSKIFGNELYNFFKKSKILLNIHFFDNPILERPRLNEALLSGIRIISEKPCSDDMEVYEKYKDVVDFIEIIGSDITELKECIDRILLELKNEDLCKIRKNKVDLVVKDLEIEFKEKMNSIFNINNF
jgi:hypothetical protein